MMGQFWLFNKKESKEKKTYNNVNDKFRMDANLISSFA